ncbi:MarR family transcriptional regulator [Sphingomonas sp. C8-2]|jgi:DNA-binding MarR family transcriptional regulator|nr:MarR family transcriptional regulator [Sphingomonas sp. C8-2]
MTAKHDKKAPARNERFNYRSWPFYWIARASGRYRGRMEEMLRDTALDMPRWRVLMTLHQDRVASVSEIAAHSSEKLPTMTRIIQRMEADGLVRRRPRPGREHVMEVVLTDAGELAGNEAWARADSIYGQAFVGMTDAELEQLTGLLQRVAENLKASGE